MASEANTTSSEAAPSKRAASRKPATSKSVPAAKRTTAKRDATAASSARTKAAKATAAEAKSGAALVGSYAERAVLVPVGAALTAGDRVAEIVGDVLQSYSTRKKTVAQLKRFERRGISARDVLEREARKAGKRAERVVKRRRQTVEHGISSIDRRREEAQKAVVDGVDEVATQVRNAATKVEETAKSIV